MQIRQINSRNIKTTPDSHPWRYFYQIHTEGCGSCVNVRSLSVKTHSISCLCENLPQARSTSAHTSYRLFVPFDVSPAGQAGRHVPSQAGQLVLEEASKTEQHGAQEQVLLLGFAAGRPEPAHGQEGAEGLGGRLVPHKELH